MNLDEKSNENILSILRQHQQWSSVMSIHTSLKNQGYKALLAGGCVRDALLGKLASDIDIATDATPDQIEQLFEKTVNVGKKFGVMRVLHGDCDIEVATFRNDGVYVDGRHPQAVQFSSPQEDAQRRDFTINALFFDLDQTCILDFVEGQKDLRAKIIRTVGVPEKRFQEDQLRLLRGARFAAQLGFSVEAATLHAMTRLSGLIKNVSGERIRDELGKMLKSKDPSLGLHVMSVTGLMSQLFPWREIQTGKDFFKFEISWSNENHKNFALFFKGCEKNELCQGLDLLKVSNQQRKFIEDSWSIWSDPESFFKQRRGLQIQNLFKQGVEWALQVLARHKKFNSEIEGLMNQKNRLGAHLPGPFLKGSDIVKDLQGEEIGRCLQEAFYLQLEDEILDRDQALSWFAKYLHSSQGGK